LVAKAPTPILVEIQDLDRWEETARTLIGVPTYVPGQRRADEVGSGSCRSGHASTTDKWPSCAVGVHGQVHVSLFDLHLGHRVTVDGSQQFQLDEAKTTRKGTSDRP
jgi:hypothetical protein